MTTKQSTAPWADEPYALLPTPQKVQDTNTHSALFCATEMAHAHNSLIRGLNSILLQGPHIPSSLSPDFNRTDVSDLLFYTLSWTKTITHHHDTEESTMFPLIEKLAKTPGLMAGAVHQHGGFHGGIVELGEYCGGFGGREEMWRWDDMTGVIDGFAGSLVNHLREEIEILLGLEKSCDSEGLKRVWDEAERVAKANGNLGLLYEVFPLVLGTCDKTYEGGNAFPPLPAPVPYAIKYWFGRSHSGAWRFNPCDFWGKPVPLHFLPENRGK